MYQNKKVHKKTISILLAASLVIAGGLYGCDSKQAASGTQESVMEETNTEVSQEVSREESQEATQKEEVLSQEELYWQQVLESFSDSEYDLTAALTAPSLKDYCTDYFSLGVGINGSSLDNLTTYSKEYMAVAKKHFNSCTMSNLMKSGYLLRQKESIDNAADGDGSPVLGFETIDDTLAWCMENGMKMRGHTLVWHAQTPDWFFREGYKNDGAYVDKETMLFRMESYIKQVLTHVQDNYPGVIYCWDVVNEAVELGDGGDSESFFHCRVSSADGPNPWYTTIGEDYVEMAFTYARKYAAEDVKLFYNDYNTFDITKQSYIIKLCEYLKEKGLIDGIGMQGYWGVDWPSQSALEIAIKMYAKLGLEIQITELSVGVEEETEEQFLAQARRYFNIFMFLMNLDTQGGGSANITNVTLFGLKDHYVPGDKTNARLFDTNFQPKEAFTRVEAILRTVYNKNNK